MAVGTPVGVPAQVGTYRKPSVAVVANATEPPATTLPAAVMRARSVELVPKTSGALTLVSNVVSVDDDAILAREAPADAISRFD